jgi:hypothetical protein
LSSSYLSLSPSPQKGESCIAHSVPTKEKNQRREHDGAQQAANPQFGPAIVFQLHVAGAIASGLKPHQAEAVGFDLAGRTVGRRMPSGMMGNLD